MEKRPDSAIDPRSAQRNFFVLADYPNEHEQPCFFSYVLERTGLRTIGYEFWGAILPRQVAVSPKNGRIWRDKIWSVGYGGSTMNQLNAEPLRALTRRRRQVAKLACRGLSNREIAEKLGLIEGTVKVHLHAVYEKLNIHSRTKLAIALMKMQQVKMRDARSA
jgi:DNA-binding CsgD family transcriptional regulator